eukprot:COSAG01_NODE_2114_length_8392_cov_6.483058_3_plen_144_part_00
MSDDQGWADVSYNTQTFNFTPVVRPRTPELDEMSSSPHTIVFTRFYAGSAVCSPTRASVLTGRTSERECIYGAGERSRCPELSVLCCPDCSASIYLRPCLLEGCGQAPAWRCADRFPLPPTIFTLAHAAALKNFTTLFVGKCV